MRTAALRLRRAQPQRNKQQTHPVSGINRVHTYGKIGGKTALAGQTFPGLQASCANLLLESGVNLKIQRRFSALKRECECLQRNSSLLYG